MVLLSALVALGGCSDDGFSPHPPPPEAPLAALPLAVGSTWDYALTFDATWRDANGNDVRAPFHLDGAGTRALTGCDTISGRLYVIEEQAAAAVGDTLRRRWRRLRQTTDAFYQADLPLNIAPGDVPPDAEVGELVRLHFPVTAGDTWNLRDGNPGVTLTVEARDTLTVAGRETHAWRVRIDPATAGPNDATYVWYGTAGLLRREVHAEITAIDVNTGDTVYITTDETEVLLEARIAD